MAITSNVYISYDADAAAMIDLSTAFVYELGYNLPLPKYNKIELPGMNGVFDMTDALGVYFGNRLVNISLAVKNGTANGDGVCNAFISAYDGNTVRVYIGTDFYFRGRCTVIGDNRADACRQLSVQIDADPLRYDTSYTPNDYGQIINPKRSGSNLWSSLNVSATTAGAAVTMGGGTISASGSAEAVFVFSNDAATAGKLFRIEFNNLDGCIVDDVGGTRMMTEKAYILLANGADVNIVLRRYGADAASFECIIQEIETTTINNTGAAVPLELADNYNALYKKYIFLNDCVFQYGFSGYKSRPELMLRPGANLIATFVDYSNYTPPTVTLFTRVRYRRGVI